MISFMEINVNILPTHGSMSNINNTVINDGGPPSASVPLATTTPQQQQPKLKRSPYLAAMCEDGYDGQQIMLAPEQDDVAADSSAIAPLRRRRCSEGGEVGIGMSMPTLHQSSTLLSSTTSRGSMTRNGKNGGAGPRRHTSGSHSNKRHYSDFFELKRPRSLSSSGVVSNSSPGLGSSSGNLHLPNHHNSHSSATGNQGRHHNHSHSASTSSRNRPSTSSLSFSSGDTTSGNSGSNGNNGGGKVRPRRGPSTNRSQHHHHHHRGGPFATRASSMHSLPPQHAALGGVGVASSSSGNLFSNSKQPAHQLQRGTSSGSGYGLGGAQRSGSSSASFSHGQGGQTTNHIRRHSNTPLQYYYPNPFSQGNLRVELLQGSSSRGSLRHSLQQQQQQFHHSHSVNEVDDFKDDNESGNSSEDSDDDEECERNVRMRGSTNTSFPLSPGVLSLGSGTGGSTTAASPMGGADEAGSSSHQNQFGTLMPSVQPLTFPSSTTYSNNNVTHSPPPPQEQLRHRYSSLPAMNQAQHHQQQQQQLKHPSSKQFFESVLDPLDGREHDLNRESRNEIWKEIGFGGDNNINNGNGNDERTHTEMQEDAAMEEAFDEGVRISSDNGTSAADGQRSSSALSSSSSSAQQIPCVSDDNFNPASDRSNTSADDSLSLSLDKNNGLVAATTAAMGSSPSWGNVNNSKQVLRSSKPRRSQTVGAGLAYGRIPDWHVRSRLSK